MKHLDGTKAIVVGGGIGGLAAAIALRRVGVEAVVFESAPELTSYGGGLKLWTNATRALKALGVGEDVIGAGEVIERVQFLSRQGKMLGDWPVGDLGRQLGSPTIGVLRPKLRQVLIDALENDAVRPGSELIDFDQDEHGVTARFADGVVHQGAFLIGADGLHSLVRARLRGKEAPRYAGYAAWRGVPEPRPDLTPPGTFQHFWGAGARFVYYPVGDNRVYFDAMANAREGEHEPIEARKAALLSRYRGFGRPVEALIEATHASSIARVDLYDRPPVTSWGHGRVTLLGDAAHPMTPNQGQGAGTALEDAVVLANCLATESDLVTALRAYERKQMKRTAEFVKVSRGLGALGRWEHPVACAVRTAAMRGMYATFAWWREKQHVAYEFGPGPLTA